MKKMILALTTLAIAGASVQTASAGGCGSCGWSTAGQVLAGVTAGLAIGQALTPRQAYYAAPATAYYPAPGYGYAYAYGPPAQPAVVYAAPAPVVYAAPAPVVLYRPRVCVAAPVVTVGFGYYGGCRPHYYCRGCW
jgi:hypothetical protein